MPQGRCNFPALSVAENLRLGAYTRHLPRSALETQVERMSVRFPRLKERWNTLAGNLSGGEQQMLEMGMVLMARPRLLLLDEPSLGLAPRAMDSVFATIRELTGDGITVLMVEHNLSVVADLTDTITVLARGEVLAEGTYDRVSRDPAVIEAYMGTGHG